MRKSKFVLVANESIWVNKDFIQIWEAVKIFEPHYSKLKLFIVYLWVKGTFLAYSCEQIVEVTSL